MTQEEIRDKHTHTQTLVEVCALTCRVRARGEMESDGLTTGRKRLQITGAKEKEKGNTITGERRRGKHA